MHFLEWKCINFEYNLTEVCSQESNSQYSIIGSHNGLAPRRPQTIIWTNDGQGWWRYMTHSVSMSFFGLKLFPKIQFKYTHTNKKNKEHKYKGFEHNYRSMAQQSRWVINPLSTILHHLSVNKKIFSTYRVNKHINSLSLKLGNIPVVRANV